MTITVITTIVCIAALDAWNKQGSIITTIYALFAHKA